MVMNLSGSKCRQTAASKRRQHLGRGERRNRNRDSRSNLGGVRQTHVKLRKINWGAVC